MYVLRVDDGVRRRGGGLRDDPAGVASSGGHGAGGGDGAGDARGGAGAHRHRGAAEAASRGDGARGGGARARGRAAVRPPVGGATEDEDAPADVHRAALAPQDDDRGGVADAYRAHGAWRWGGADDRGGEELSRKLAAVEQWRRRDVSSSGGAAGAEAVHAFGGGAPELPLSTSRTAWFVGEGASPGASVEDVPRSRDVFIGLSRALAASCAAEARTTRLIADVQRLKQDMVRAAGVPCVCGSRRAGVRLRRHPALTHPRPPVQLSRRSRALISSAVTAAGTAITLLEDARHAAPAGVHNSA